MSPVAALLDQTLSPVAILAALICEWWAVWFTLGRSALPTFLLTLSANAASLSLAAVAVASGALGPISRQAGEPAARVTAWIGAGLLVLGVVFLVEALVLRTCMRRSRPTWSWNPYDLLAFLAANSVSIGVAAVSLWLSSRA